MMKRSGPANTFEAITVRHSVAAWLNPEQSTGALGLLGAGLVGLALAAAAGLIGFLGDARIGLRSGLLEADQSGCHSDPFGAKERHR
jgi:hypothetical protein